MTTPRRKILRAAGGPAAVFLAGALVAVVACWLSFRRESRQIADTLREREVLRVTGMGRQFNQALREISATLHIFAASETLQEYLDGGSPEHLARLSREALSISQHHGEFDKIRYIDETGREVVRINSSTGIVATEELQAKGDRPFFQEAAALPAGATYVSKFDLNVDQGRLDLPLHPTLRLATPVFDHRGRARGIIIINYRGQELIDQLTQFNPSVRHRMRLLNAEGYWLRAARPDQEWGFMLPERSGATLAQQSPTRWAQVQAQEQGQIFDAQGLFTWQRLKSETALGSSVHSADPYWILASEVSPGEWTAVFTPGRQTLVFTLLVLLVAVGGATWLYVRHRAEQDQRHAADELNAAILASAGTGIITLRADGVVLSMNAAAEQMLGWSAAEVVGRQNAGVFYDRDEMRAFAEQTGREMNRTFRHGLEALAAKVTDSREPFEREWTCVRRDGSRFVAWIANTAIRDSRGEVLRFLGVFADAGVRRATESAKPWPKK